MSKDSKGRGKKEATVKEPDLGNLDAFVRQVLKVPKKELERREAEHQKTKGK